MRRITVVLGLTGAMLALGVTGAFAANTTQANGAGQTRLSASLGFNAKSDLKGSLNYNADPNGANAGFSAHCNDYLSYELEATRRGFPKVEVTAACTDQDGTTVYLFAYFIDRGEPGTSDTVCVAWNYQAPQSKGAYIKDRGHISNGNVQIHT
jgi:hypothetical protein